MNSKGKVSGLLLTVVICILLFVPWGYARVGGQMYIRAGFSNPIWVEGAYPRGVAEALNNFSDEIDGFQEQCELVGLAIMSVLIFMAVLELVYALCVVLGIELMQVIGIVAEIPVLIACGATVILGLVCRERAFPVTEAFQIVVDIRLNAVPFLIILIEIVGKQIIPYIDRKRGHRTEENTHVKAQ